MDRVSGWYRRWVQRVLLVLALGVSVLANADTFQVASELWSDGALRSSLVAKSNQILQSEQPAPRPVAGTPAAPVADVCTRGKPAADCVQDKLDNVAHGLNDVDELGLPIGWSDANTPKTLWGWLGKLIGLAATAFALSLGAPFWFDVLGKLSRVRGVGPKPPGSDTSTNEPKAA